MKIELEITHFLGLRKGWKHELIEIECNGDGTKDHPIIFNTLENFSNVNTISESNNYIIFRDIKFIEKNKIETTLIEFLYCKNIVIENCIFDVVSLISCKDIKIITSTIRSLTLERCYDCSLTNCRISEEFIVYKCTKNLFRSNIVENIFVNLRNLSSDNILEQNEISEEYVEVFKELGKQLQNDKPSFYLGGKYGFIPGQNDMEIDCEGRGTKENPYIIKPSKLLPKRIFKRQNRDYVIFEDILRPSIQFANCKYITLLNCKFKDIWLSSCYELTLNNVKTNILDLASCKNIIIANSYIGELKLNDTELENLIFKDSRIGYTRKIKNKNTEGS